MSTHPVQLPVRWCEESTLTVLGRGARLDHGERGGPREVTTPLRRALAGVPPTPVAPNTEAS